MFFTTSAVALARLRARRPSGEPHVMGHRAGADGRPAAEAEKPRPLYSDTAVPSTLYSDTANPSTL